jgi:GTPase
MVGGDRVTVHPWDDGTDDSTGSFDLEDRAALRRVAGLSTELADVTEVEYRQVRLERVVLVGVWTEGTLVEAERSLAELSLLAQTAGSIVLDGVIQRRGRPDSSTYIGSGKVLELRDIVLATGADTVIADGELTPAQLRELEKMLKVKVVDRTWLILDIFAQHARSKEGRAQVTLAQLEYLLPRLRGWGESLSRQGGALRARGAGETKIELDRRRINDQIAKLRRELKGMARVRATKRARRRTSTIPQVAIAGYTNAGKSSLLNRFTGAGVLVEDALFATLDPTTRKARTPNGREFTLSDTVGFVRHLPHQLVESFRSTLEEINDADLVLHIVDASDDAPEEQISAVREVLAEIGATDLPELIVLNKADIADPLVVSRLRRIEPNSVIVSARTGEGIDELLRVVEELLPRPSIDIDVLLPYSRGDLLSRIFQDGEVLSQAHEAEGTRVTARVAHGLAHDLDPYRVPA